MALALLAGAAACSSDEDADPPTTTTAASTNPVATDAPTTTTTEPMSEEDEVAEAFLRAEAVFYEIAVNPDPGDPRLAEIYEEPNLSYVKEIFETSRLEGTVVEYSEAPRSKILNIQVNGADATVESCLVDDSQQVRESDGRVVNDDVSTRRSKATFIKVGDDWLAQSGETLQSWSDGRGCDR